MQAEELVQAMSKSLVEVAPVTVGSVVGKLIHSSPNLDHFRAKALVPVVPTVMQMPASGHEIAAGESTSSSSTWTVCQLLPFQISAEALPVLASITDAMHIVAEPHEVEVKLWRGGGDGGTDCEDQVPLLSRAAESRFSDKVPVEPTAVQAVVAVQETEVSPLMPLLSGFGELCWLQEVPFQRSASV